MSEQMCIRCVMDTTDPEIVFDEQGVCNHCKEAIRLLEREGKRKTDFENKILEMKEWGKGKKYDCVVGMSGGTDSSYIVYLVKQLGLRPLVVHMDNGWDSELAVQNIRTLLERLDLPLYTYVIDWQEFRDLQLSFLKASTPDSEIPTDHAIWATLYLVAVKYGIKYVIDGQNITSESIVPRRWSYGHSDWRYIKGIQKKFGSIKLKTFPYYSQLDLFYIHQVKKIECVSILNYMDYDKEKAKAFLIDEFGWKDYGGKHYESFYTKFYQSYILPIKFNADKRKMHLSSVIASGQMTREEALQELKKPLYDEKEIERDIEYFCEKMEISRAEFDEIMNRPKKYFWDYKSNETSLLGKIMKAVGGW